MGRSNMAKKHKRAKSLRRVRPIRPPLVACACLAAGDDEQRATARRLPQPSLNPTPHPPQQQQDTRRHGPARHAPQGRSCRLGPTGWGIREGNRGPTRRVRALRETAEPGETFQKKILFCLRVSLRVSGFLLVFSGFCRCSRVCFSRCSRVSSYAFSAFSIGVLGFLSAFSGFSTCARVSLRVFAFLFLFSRFSASSRFSPHVFAFLLLSFLLRHDEKINRTRRTPPASTHPPPVLVGTKTRGNSGPSGGKSILELVFFFFFENAYYATKKKRARNFAKIITYQSFRDPYSSNFFVASRTSSPPVLRKRAKRSERSARGAGYQENGHAPSVVGNIGCKTRGVILATLGTFETETILYVTI